jgi:serine/threonine protein kinase
MDMDRAELGYFSLGEKMREGGMGQVYKARDKRLECLAALKLVAEACRADADRRTPIVQGAKPASALHHPNIITVYDIDEGADFSAMNHVSGETRGALAFGPRRAFRHVHLLGRAPIISMNLSGFSTSPLRLHLTSGKSSRSEPDSNHGRHLDSRKDRRSLPSLAIGILRQCWKTTSTNRYSRVRSDKPTRNYDGV